AGAGLGGGCGRRRGRGLGHDTDRSRAAGRAGDAGDADAKPDADKKEKDDAGAPRRRSLPIHGLNTNDRGFLVSSSFFAAAPSTAQQGLWTSGEFPTGRSRPTKSAAGAATAVPTLFQRPG